MKIEKSFRKKYGIKIILTRNLRDYKNADIIVQTPETFLITNKFIS